MPPAKRKPKLTEIERMVVDPGEIRDDKLAGVMFTIFMRQGRTITFDYELGALERLAFERWLAGAIG